jgi:integrase
MSGADRLRGEWADPRLGRVLFEDHAEKVMASRVDLKPSTLARDETYLSSLILPHLGSRRIGSVTTADLEAWVAALTAAGYAAATVRKAYQIAAAVFASAVRSTLIPRSPSEGVKLPRIERTEMRFLTAEEVTGLADATGDRNRVLVLTAAYAGLRWGEIGGLRVSRLDLLRRRLTVVETLSEVRGRVMFSEPKTAASRRSVTLPRFLCDELAGHLATLLEVDPAGLVFTAVKGGPLRRTNWRRRVWLPAVAATVGDPMRFHDLRHTHAALLIAQGEHPKVIQSRLGHASIRTTLDTYGHLFEGLDEAAAERLDEAWTGSAAGWMRDEGGGEVVEWGS